MATVLVKLDTPGYQQFIDSTALTDVFSVTYANKDTWHDYLTEQPAIAIIEGNNFSSLDYERIEALQFCPDTEIIFLSDGVPNPILDKVVLKCAAHHYRTPFCMESVQELINELNQELNESVSNARTVATSQLDQFGLLYGSARIMKKLYRSMRKVASFDTSILIVGESGVGKELVAHTLHNASDRSEHPFIAVNCGAMTKELAASDLFGHIKGAFTGAHQNRDGFFKQAGAGTLFLDEVTEMPEELQVQLLRVLETGDFSPVGSNQVLHSRARIIAATNRELSEAVAEGVFREDLYFRLAQFLIHVPPLRSRGGDITELAKHFLAYKNTELNHGKQITDAALDKLTTHHWPGNVRELKNVVDRAFIVASDIIDAEHIILDNEKPLHTSAVPAGVPLAEIEKQAILNTLDEQQGNKTDTAKALDISVKTLYNKLEKYND
ncbi:sigma-54 interaction domain-containing protein [Thalassotalea euphylliae]|uniref:sigma-54 interaction domain-containing protein n=1 Tax=Thalassotalea euphylliae TaxID=1655234 RepID=UPI003644B811